MQNITPKVVISAFVLIVIGASLVSPLGDIIWGTLNTPGQWELNGSFNETYIASNVTGAGAAILALLTLFFVIVIVMVAVKHIRS